MRRVARAGIRGGPEAVRRGASMIDTTDRQPHPEAVLLGGVERIEDPLQVSCARPTPVSPLRRARPSRPLHSCRCARIGQLPAADRTRPPSHDRVHDQLRAPAGAGAGGLAAEGDPRRATGGHDPMAGPAQARREPGISRKGIRQIERRTLPPDFFSRARVCTITFCRPCSHRE